MCETKTVWHPYPKEKPPKQMESYLTTMPKEIIGINCFVTQGFGLYDNEVIAWAELPEPYNPEEK